MTAGAEPSSSIRQISRSERSMGTASIPITESTVSTLAEVETFTRCAEGSVEEILTIDPADHAVSRTILSHSPSTLAPETHPKWLKGTYLPVAEWNWPALAGRQVFHA